LFGDNDVTDKTPVDKDLTSPLGKYVIIKGCDYTGYIDQRRRINQRIWIKFNEITNPYSVRDTSVFKMEVYKDWDATNGLQRKIIETQTSVIP